MNAEKTPQTMKPTTAAKKLGIYLPAAPAEFQEAPVSRSTLNELLESPPEWLVELRRTGPHPRDIVARKLGVSISGLARAGVTEALTTDEITALLQSPPEWLVNERRIQAEVRAENRRVKDVKLGKAAAAADRAADA
ncbi:DUF5997 family protein [Herbiconiux sp. KACC 21604]|uniref:DUF5997 family protein n=1 Tax=unclassified Herbiconiux TaxID=2618217 RepID=UPI001490ADE6|nr:DUF5997 family protein [Herbiconiux sp. SALV-R1]QJU55766.1 hypothetical protein HL652_20515 [Herbiconiux sp. SALV-R1]WPO86974.1 DUF5997 family protein [Herbiconiux sp. KACC 21604]